MSRIHAIVEMEQTIIDDIIEKDPAKFIRMCLEEICFLEGKIEGYEECLGLLHDKIDE